MKKFLAFFLVIAIMLTSCIALISCNGNNDVPGGNGDDDNGTTPDFASMEPDEMFKTAVSYTLTQGTDAAFSLYEKIFTGFENTLSGTLNDTAASGAIDVEVSPVILGSVLPGVSLNKITAEYDVNFISDTGAAADLLLSCGDVELGKAEIYFEKSTSDLYLALPGLIEDTLKINLTDAFSSDIPSDIPIDTLSSIKFSKYISAVKDYIPKALDLVLDKISGVEKSETTITANGVTANAVMLTTKLTATVARDMVIAVIDDLMTNEEIKELIIGFYNDNAAALGFDYYESADALYEELMAMLEEEKAYITEDFTDNGEELTIKLYLDSEYTHLIGTEIELPDDEFTYSLLYAENGNDIGEEFSCTVDGETISSLSFKATKSDNGLFNGTMTIETEGMEILTVELENVNYEKAKDGDFSGKYTLIPGEALSDSVDSLIDPSSMKLVIDIKEISSDKADFSLALLMAGFDVDSDTTLIKLSITNEKTDSETITFPTETVSDAEAWAASINTDELMSRLAELGLTEDILSGYMY